jgi:uncharacterized protein YbcI
MKFQFLKKLFFCMVVSLSINMQASESKKNRFSSVIDSVKKKFTGKRLRDVPAEPIDESKIAKIETTESKKNRFSSVIDSVKKKFTGKRLRDVSAEPIDESNIAKIKTPVDESSEKLSDVLKEEKEQVLSLQDEKKILETKFKSLNGRIKHLMTPEQWADFDSDASVTRAISRYKNEIEYIENVLANSVNAKDADPELYDVFLKIKKDMGIDEDVTLRIRTDDAFTNDAEYDPFFYIVLINKNYKNESKSFIVNALVHELEHHRQYNRYFGSYAFSNLEDRRNSVRLGTQSPTGIHLKLEAGAEATAAGYFDCSECLKDIANKRNALEYNSDPNLPSGYFRSTCGYFVKEDYDPYIERALQDGKLCKGHELLSKIPVDDVEKLKEVSQHLPIAHFLPDEAK